MLSSLYSYGALAYVGGGFRKRGLHNILEPAAFGLPILIGPEFSNFIEAIRFVEQKFAFPVRSASEAQQIFSELTGDPLRLSQLTASIRSFLQQQSGASETVLQYIESRKWLE
jgi:3-deoxy-D-manno-octulosonic-acid transferase